MSTSPRFPAGGAACLGFPGWAHRGGRSRTEAGAAYSGTFGILRHADGYVPAIAVGVVAARGPARRAATRWSQVAMVGRSPYGTRSGRYC